MNLAYIHSGKWPSNSPSSTFITYNCLSLAKESDKCHLFVKDNSKEPTSKILSSCFKIKKPDSLIIHRMKGPLFSSNYFYYKNVEKKINSILKQDKLQALITRRTSFLPFLVKLKKRHRLKVFFETHDFYADLSLRNDINKRKKKKQSHYEKKYIPRLDGLICLQHSQKNLYSKVFPSADIKVFRTGIIKQVKSPLQKKYITYIGSLDSLKGIKTLIESLTYCRQKHKFLIIGGKNKNQIKKTKEKIKQKAPGADIKITGWVDKKKLDELLKQTKIGIVPLSDTFFNRYITSPLKLFDYFGYGIPVIASELPSTRELIKENSTGLFFTPGKAQQLAEKIDMLSSDNAKLQEMRKNIFAGTSNLLWEKRAQNIIKWIKEK